MSNLVELSEQDCENVNGAIIANVAGAAAGAVGGFFGGIIAGDSGFDLAVSTVSGAFFGGFNPVRGFGSLVVNAGGGIGAGSFRNAAEDLRIKLA